MIIIPTLVARATEEGLLPQGCKPFSLQNGVCVGDMIAILACGISGFGFVLWGIHAIYKMRHEFPFNWKEEDQLTPVEDPPFYVPSANDNSILSRGIRKTPNFSDRVRTRMFFTYPEEEFYKQTVLIPADAYGAGIAPAAETPRHPPPVSGQSKRTSSHHPGRHASLLRAGPPRDYEDEHIRDASIKSGLAEQWV